jgi:hypothetical protein
MGLAVQSRGLWHYKLGMSIVTPYLQPCRVAGPHWNLALAGFHHLEGHPNHQ